VNSDHHASLTKCALRYAITHGIIPRHLVETAEERAAVVAGSVLPDLVDDVLCGGKPVQFGHNLTSLQHSQPGYRWQSDPSLSILGEPSGWLTALAGMRITLNPNPTKPPPLSGLLLPSPMDHAISGKPMCALGSFLFPSAAEVAEFYGTAACTWTDRYANPVGWRACLGYLLHSIQDSCVPHHAWSALLFGHQDFEDSAETLWVRDIAEIEQLGQVDAMHVHVGRELADITATTLADICVQNAAWAVHRWGQPHYLGTCPDNDAMAVSMRAIAASVHAIELVSA
jgi:hypothetical protein